MEEQRQQDAMEEQRQQDAMLECDKCDNRYWDGRRDGAASGWSHPALWWFIGVMSCLAFTEWVL